MTDIEKELLIATLDGLRRLPLAPRITPLPPTDDDLAELRQAQLGWSDQEPQ